MAEIKSDEYKAAEKDALSALDSLPRKYLGVSPKLLNEMHNLATEKQAMDGFEETVGVNIYRPHEMPVHVCKQFKGKKWEIVDRQRLDSLLLPHN